MPIHVPLPVHEHKAHFFVFLRSGGHEGKARELGPILSRMPPEHAEVFRRYLIFVIRQKPGGGPGGGTWRPTEVFPAFRGRERRTGVSDEDLMRLVVSPERGLIGIPEDRWSRPVNLLKFTVLHEIGHAVDYCWNLSAPGAVERDYRGVRPACGGSDPVKRRVVEAYARWILGSPSICRDPVDENAAAANQRIIGLLRRSPALVSRSVPPDWHPGR